MACRPFTLCVPSRRPEVVFRIVTLHDEEDMIALQEPELEWGQGGA